VYVSPGYGVSDLVIILFIIHEINQTPKL